MRVRGTPDIAALIRATLAAWSNCSGKQSVPCRHGCRPIELPVQAGADDIIGQLDVPAGNSLARSDDDRRHDVARRSEVGMQVFEFQRQGGRWTGPGRPLAADAGNPAGPVLRLGYAGRRYRV